jgi:hypothetical protein
VRSYRNVWLPVLVLAAILLVAACSGSVKEEQGSAEQGGSEEPTGNMQGMEHSGIDMTSGQMMDASELAF